MWVGGGVWGLYACFLFNINKNKYQDVKTLPENVLYTPLTDMCVTVYFNSIGEWVLDLPIEIETTTLNSELKLGAWWHVW